MNDNTAAPAPHPIYGQLTVVPPDREAEAVVARMDQLNSSLKPWDFYECRLTFEVARETLRLGRLHQAEIALRAAQAAHAAAHWDVSHRSAALALAAGLSRHPALVLARLRDTRHGNELVADRWDILASAVEKRGDWTAPERLLALNLLDVPPDLREAPSDLDVPDGDDPRAHLLSIAAREARRHRDYAAALTPVDAIEREAAALGLAPDSPDLAAVNRAERSVTRRLAWFRSQFKATRRDPRPPDPGDLPASVAAEAYNARQKAKAAATPVAEPKPADPSATSPSPTPPHAGRAAPGPRPRRRRA